MRKKSGNKKKKHVVTILLFSLFSRSSHFAILFKANIACDINREKGRDQVDNNEGKRTNTSDKITREMNNLRGFST